MIAKASSIGSFEFIRCGIVSLWSASDLFTAALRFGCGTAAPLRATQINEDAAFMPNVQALATLGRG